MLWFKHILFLQFKLTCKTYIHTIIIYRIGMKAYRAYKNVYALVWVSTQDFGAY